MLVPGSYCVEYERMYDCSFLQRLTERYSDWMPDCDELQIPYHQKQDMYERFVLEFCKLHDMEPPFIAHFLCVRKDHCSNIKVNRTSRFARFILCEELDGALQATIGGRRDTTSLKARKTEHISTVMKERLDYRKRPDNAFSTRTDTLKSLLRCWRVCIWTSTLWNNDKTHEREGHESRARRINGTPRTEPPASIYDGRVARDWS